MVMRLSGPVIRAPAFYNTGTQYRQRIAQDVVILNNAGLLIGDTTQRTVGGVIPELQLLGTGNADTATLIGRWSADSSGAEIRYLKSRNATIGSNTIVQDGDRVVTIVAYGDDGTDYETPVGAIYIEIDGTPGADDMPGRIILATTADGAATSTERWRITNAGVLRSNGAQSITTSSGDLTLNPAGNVVVTSRILFVGDTANANQTQGITINQDGADNEALTLKSSDVGHGVTTRTESDTFFFIQKASATDGGVEMQALAESTASVGFLLLAVAGTDNTAKTTAARGYVELRSDKINGSSVTDPGVDANIVVFRPNGTARFIFDVEGSGHADVEWIAFDDHDDIALMDAMQREWTGRITPAKYGENPLYYHREYLEATGIIGKDSWHYENRGGAMQFRSMVNFTKLAMLHHGALLQLADRLTSLEAATLNLKGIMERFQKELPHGDD